MPLCVLKSLCEGRDTFFNVAMIPIPVKDDVSCGRGGLCSRFSLIQTSKLGQFNSFDDEYEEAERRKSRSVCISCYKTKSEFINNRPFSCELIHCFRYREEAHNCAL